MTKRSRCHGTTARGTRCQHIGLTDGYCTTHWYQEQLKNGYSWNGAEWVKTPDGETPSMKRKKHKAKIPSIPINQPPALPAPELYWRMNQETGKHCCYRRYGGSMRMWASLCGVDMIKNTTWLRDTRKPAKERKCAGCDLLEPRTLRSMADAQTTPLRKDKFGSRVR